LGRRGPWARPAVTALSLADGRPPEGGARRRGSCTRPAIMQLLSDALRAGVSAATGVCIYCRWLQDGAENSDAVEKPADNAKLKEFFADVEKCKALMGPIRKNIKDLEKQCAAKLMATQVDDQRNASAARDENINKTKDLCKELKTVLDRIRASNEEFNKARPYPSAMLYAVWHASLTHAVCDLSAHCPYFLECRRRLRVWPAEAVQLPAHRALLCRLRGARRRLSCASGRRNMGHSRGNTSTSSRSSPKYRRSACAAPYRRMPRRRVRCVQRGPFCRATSLREFISVHEPAVSACAAAPRSPLCRAVSPSAQHVATYHSMLQLVSLRCNILRHRVVCDARRCKLLGTTGA
jgi:hypothetical protein